MGLDMYLRAKKYLTVYQPKERELSQKISELLGIRKADEPLTEQDFDAKRVSEIAVSVAYWRKANHIHNWFVENVQYGVDKCQPSYVSREHLEKLRDICKEVLDDPDKAEELLPTQDGFFFGSTDYDRWYFDHVRYTLKMLTSILEDESLDDEYSFEYQSSW